MIEGVAAVWLPVQDMRRAKRFYGETLELRITKEDQDDWVEVEGNGLRIGLNAREATRGEGGAVITFQPDGGLDGAVEGLRGKGVEFPGGISEHPWGRIATFKDPEGNVLQLYEPPR